MDVKKEAVLRKSEYAKHRGVSPAMVTHWVRAGRLVLDASGKRVDVIASDAALAGSLDPSRGGKGGGPNAKRNTPRAAKAAGGAQDEAPPAPGRPVDPNSPTSRFTEHRATREGFVAKEAELRYLERAGALVPRAEYDRAVRDCMIPIAGAIDSLAPRIARIVAGKTDVRAIEAAIEAEIESIRADALKGLRILMSEPDKVRQ